ncbi:MAG: hypothetical protein LVS60_10825 [Nodosilinea sp. LVE1205-7]
MLHQFTRIGYRRLAYIVLAAVVALTIGLTTATPSRADLLDLLFQGIRYVELSNLSDRERDCPGKPD